ncbi:MAG TPA: ASPIC/UnbV domain-containing protein [Gemmatimonadaceae bacterium]|nr:ASPIC/UnbV domain-containing protein [Gemmatimonadaceae bacterium]
MPRTQYPLLNPAGGYLAQSSKTLHFGLGEKAAVDSVVIRWPRGARQILIRPAINARLERREPR